MGLALAIGVLAASTPAKAAPDETFTIRVLALNQANVPDVILNRAQLEAMRIFSSMGIMLLWTTRTPGEPYPGSAQQLKIMIIPDLRTKRHLRMLGVAQRFNMAAYAFYSRIEDFAQHNGTALARLLGAVIAHELGHLLLPYDSHTSSGLMRAEWDHRQLKDMANGLLAFTPEQAELIRTHVRATLTN